MADWRVELSRAAYEAWNRGDLDAFVAVFDPDCVVHTAVGPEPYHGHEGVRAWAADILDSFGRFSLVTETIEVIGERGLALAWVELEGQTSGVALKQPLAHVAEFGDGRIRSLRTYLDHDEARRAATG